jgi:hypothetical protein
MTEVSVDQLCAAEQQPEEGLKTTARFRPSSAFPATVGAEPQPRSASGGALSPTIFSTRRARRTVVAVALGGGLALGITGLAQAAEPPTPSGSASAPAGPPAGGPGYGPGRGHGPGDGRAHQPHLAGTVKAITDTRITITDRDGFTRQIIIKSKPDGVAVGTRIHAEGTVNADGVSLDATSVGVAPERPGRPGGGPGPRGGGWPEGARPSAPAPSAS